MTTQYTANSIKSVSMTCENQINTQIVDHPVNLVVSDRYGTCFNTIVGYPTCPNNGATFPGPSDYSLNYGYYIPTPSDFPVNQCSMSYTVIVAQGTNPGVVQILGCNSGGGGGSYNDGGTAGNAGTGGTSGYLVEIIVYLVSNNDMDTEYSIACGLFCDSYCGGINGNGSSGTPYSIIITNQASDTLTITIPDNSSYTDTTMGYCGPEDGGYGKKSKFSDECTPLPTFLPESPLLFSGEHTLNGKTSSLRSTYTYLNTNDTTVSQSMQTPTPTSPDGLTVCNGIFPEVYLNRIPYMSSVCAGGALGSLPTDDAATTSNILSVGRTSICSPYLPFTQNSNTKYPDIVYSSIPGGSYGAYLGNEQGAVTSVNSIGTIATDNGIVSSEYNYVCCSFGNGGNGGLKDSDGSQTTLGVASPPTLGFISFVFVSYLDYRDVTDVIDITKIVNKKNNSVK